MKGDVRLVYMASETIFKFCVDHPMRWPLRERAHKAGNLRSPTPAVAVFFDKLIRDGSLFTMEDYIRTAHAAWDTPEHGWWFRSVAAQHGTNMVGCYDCRLGRNFYPSCIDSLYVWALCVEHGGFERCMLSTLTDAVGKTDLRVWRNGQRLSIGLRRDNVYSRKWEARKARRGPRPDDYVEVRLTDRPMGPGNRRWYTLADLAKAGVIDDDDSLPF